MLRQPRVRPQSASASRRPQERHRPLYSHTMSLGSFETPVSVAAAPAAPDALGVESKGNTAWVQAYIDAGLRIKGGLADTATRVRGVGKSGPHQLRVYKHQLPWEFNELYVRFLSMLTVLQRQQMMMVVDDLWKDGVEHANNPALQQLLWREVQRAQDERQRVAQGNDGLEAKRVQMMQASERATRELEQVAAEKQAVVLAKEALSRDSNAIDGERALLREELQKVRKENKKLKAELKKHHVTVVTSRSQKGGPSLGQKTAMQLKHAAEAQAKPETASGETSPAVIAITQEAAHALLSERDGMEAEITRLLPRIAELQKMAQDIQERKTPLKQSLPSARTGHLGANNRGGRDARTRVKLQRRANKRGPHRRGRAASSRRGYGSVYGERPGIAAGAGFSLAYGAYESFAAHASGPGRTLDPTGVGGYPPHFQPPGMSATPASAAQIAAMAAIGAAASANTGRVGATPPGMLPEEKADAPSEAPSQSGNLEGGTSQLSGGGNAGAEESLETKCTRLVVELEQAREAMEWERVATDEGTYFHNPSSGETSWQRPVPPTGDGERDEPAALLPPGWEQLVSAEGHPYFFNELTQETRWEPPEPPVQPTIEEMARRETAASEQ